MKLKGKVVMVTGGAGFIGSHLIDRLVKENPAKLVVVDNFFLGNEENLAHSVNTYDDLKIIRMDASDFSAMSQIARSDKVEVVFDLAVVPLPTSLDYPVWTVEKNISIATCVSELARAGDIETLIHTSSSESYGTAQSIPMDESHPLAAETPYAASKAAGDLIVQSYRRTFMIDTAVVRPFNNFGPRQNFHSYAGIIPIVVKRVRSGLPIEIYGDGEQTRDYIYVRDTVEAFIRIYEEEKTRGQVINIGTGQETTVNDLVASMLKVMGIPEYPVVHTQPRPGDVRRHCADIKLAQELIEFQPKVISDQDLNETVEWYQMELTK